MDVVGFFLYQKKNQSDTTHIVPIPPPKKRTTIAHPPLLSSSMCAWTEKEIIYMFVFSRCLWVSRSKCASSSSSSSLLLVVHCHFGYVCEYMEAIRMFKNGIKMRLTAKKMMRMIKTNNKLNNIQKKREKKEFFRIQKPGSRKEENHDNNDVWTTTLNNWEKKTS